ncbi:hypothetical protein SAMN03080615_00714 [Amphritea atlantica]|uniref:Uncharacterized protein n=1 Tax=Amphritea atlantica TaxID=355243 RepID=A0A1H9E7G3_9GAMM|nr:hypothetical protein [Amphritea atlantica]SEQ21183.1 hypothetical protein SAMN03080615_00714 [Amphritea atlantica]
MKSIPISVRLSPAEAAFLADFTAPDAVTPSDKLRFIINKVRKEEHAPHSLADSKQRASGYLAPALAVIEQAESRCQKQSSLLATQHYWLERSLSSLLFHAGNIKQSDDAIQLYERECLKLLVNTTGQQLRQLKPPLSSSHNPDILDNVRHKLDELMNVQGVNDE